MLYTSMPLEAIFPAETTVPLQEVFINGRLCLVKRGPDGSPRLERLISTDPKDYLNPRFAPNTLLDL